MYFLRDESGEVKVQVVGVKGFDFSFFTQLLHGVELVTVRSNRRGWVLASERAVCTGRAADQGAHGGGREIH